MKTIYLESDGIWVQDWDSEPTPQESSPEEPDDLWWYEGAAAASLVSM